VAKEIPCSCYEDVYLTDNEEGAFAQFQLSEILVDKFIVSPDDQRNVTNRLRFISLVVWRHYKLINEDL
jgi:hypothetical protein